MHWAALSSKVLFWSALVPSAAAWKEYEKLPRQVKPGCCHMPGHRPLGMHKAGLPYPVCLSGCPQRFRMCLAGSQRAYVTETLKSFCFWRIPSSQP